MSKAHLAEKATLKVRSRSLSVLALFTIAIAVISVIAMDILILPLSLFAINHTEIFSLIIRKATLVSVVCLILFFFIRRIIQLKHNSLSGTDIFLYILRRAGHYTALIIIFISISSTLITLILYLVSSNDLLIHRITGS